MSKSELRAELETISSDEAWIDDMVAAMTPHGFGREADLPGALQPRAPARPEGDKIAIQWAECLVYSLTPSGVLAENHPKNRGFVGILRGQKCLRRRFLRRSPVGEWSRGPRRMGGVPPLGDRAEDRKRIRVCVPRAGAQARLNGRV